MTQPRMKVWEHAVSLILFGTMGVQLRDTRSEHVTQTSRPAQPTLPAVSENSALGLGLVQATDYSKDLETLQNTLERNYADTLDTEILTPLPDLLEKAAKMTMLLGHARTLSPRKSVYELTGAELTQAPFDTLIRVTRRLHDALKANSDAVDFDGTGLGVIKHKAPRQSWEPDRFTYLAAYNRRLVAISVPRNESGRVLTRVYRLGTKAVVLDAPRDYTEAAMYHLVKEYTPALYGDRALIERLHADGTLTGEVVTDFLQPAGGPDYTAPWHTSSRDGITHTMPLQPLPDMPKPSRRLHAKRKRRKRPYNDPTPSGRINAEQIHMERYGDTYLIVYPGRGYARIVPADQVPEDFKGKQAPDDTRGDHTIENYEKGKHRDVPLTEIEADGKARSIGIKAGHDGTRARMRISPLQWSHPPGSAEAKAKAFEETKSAHLQRGIREFRQAHLGPAIKARQAQNIPGEHLGGRDDMRFKIPESTIDRVLAFKRLAHKAQQLFTAHPLALKPDYFDGADFIVCANPNRKGEAIRTIHFIFLYEGRTVGLTISYWRGCAIGMQETHYGVYGNPRIKLPVGMQIFRGDKNLIRGLVARQQLKGEWARYAMRGGD